MSLCVSCCAVRGVCEVEMMKCSHFGEVEGLCSIYFLLQ